MMSFNLTSDGYKINGLSSQTLLALRSKEKNLIIYTPHHLFSACIIGDGDHQRGARWEQIWGRIDLFTAACAISLGATSRTLFS